MSLDGDQAQESFLDVLCRQFWGCEQTTPVHRRARQALSHPMPMGRKQGGLSVPPRSRVSPGVREVARRGLLGHCSRFSRPGWWTVKVELLLPLASGRKDRR